MAIQGTVDNNQSFITRAGNVTDANVTNINVGDNQMLSGNDYTTNAAVTGTVTSVDDDVKSRDSDNQLGNQGMATTRSEQLVYSWAETLPPSGTDIHGQVHPHFTQDRTSTTFSDDEASNDGRGDGGEFFYGRSGQIPATQSYQNPTG